MVHVSSHIVCLPKVANSGRWLPDFAAHPSQAETSYGNRVLHVSALSNFHGLYLRLVYPSNSCGWPRSHAGLYRLFALILAP